MKKSLFWNVLFGLLSLGIVSVIVLIALTVCGKIGIWWGIGITFPSVIVLAIGEDKLLKKRGLSKSNRSLTL